MSQHDYVIDDQNGAGFLAEINVSIAAIVSNNSGATEPPTTYAYQWWADTTSGLLKIRNAANSVWVEVGTLADANLGLIKVSDIGTTVQAYDADIPTAIISQALAEGGTDTDPYTWTAERVNQAIGANPVAFRGALVTNSATQSIPDVANTIATFDTEEYDTDAIHSASSNTGRLTVPSGATYVRLSALVDFDNITTHVGYRRARIVKNGNTSPPHAVGTTDLQLDVSQTNYLTTKLNLSSPIMPVTGGDYFEVSVYQNSGAALNLYDGGGSIWFAMEIIE